MRKRLGCLSTSGIAAAILTLLAIAAVSLLWGGQLFSPGPLNAEAGQPSLGGVSSHADTGGRCAACHPAPWSPETMSDRCLTCHVVVGDELSGASGLHGALQAQDQAEPCYKCHSEHRGADASLTRIDIEDFPHSAVGYWLAEHVQLPDGRPFACEDCHMQSLAVFDQATCSDCHHQLNAEFTGAHAAAFGSDCLSCHDGSGALGAAFDHNRLSFPLEGRHAEVSCAECHPGARSLADLRAAPLACAACHEADDAHDGAFGQDCGQCHSPDSWQDATFDHSLTGFALTGAHAGIDCGDCHTGGVYQGTPQECVGCHGDDDAHDGGFGQDCGQCHTPDNWQDATFDHSLTGFALTGAHAGVDCGDCHTGGVYQGTPQDCVACHEDPAYHAGLFGSGCAECHTTSAWSPASYDRRHDFPIDHGEGGPSSCRTCHPEELPTYTCYGCHEHNRLEIAAKHREEGISDFEDCVRCHPTGREEEGREEDD